MRLKKENFDAKTSLQWLLLSFVIDFMLMCKNIEMTKVLLISFSAFLLHGHKTDIFFRREKTVERVGEGGGGSRRKECVCERERAREVQHQAWW